MFTRVQRAPWGPTKPTKKAKRKEKVSDTGGDLGNQVRNTSTKFGL